MLLKTLKARVLDNVLFVIKWRTYVTASAFVIPLVVYNGNEVVGWNLSDSVVSWSYVPVKTALVIDVILVVYYIVLIVYGLKTKTVPIDPPKDTQTEWSYWRWMSFCLSALLLMSMDIMCRNGIAIKPDLYAFALCFYGTTYLVSQIVFILRFAGRKIPTCIKITENPEKDPLKTDDGQGIAQKDENKA